MATSRCVGFALPVQTGGAGLRRSKTALQVRRRSGENVVLKLGLGQHGCACQAAAKYDPGYKKSASKRPDSKKSEKYGGSVAEASGSGRQTKKVSPGEKKDQVSGVAQGFQLAESFARSLQFSLAVYPTFCCGP